MGLCGKEAEAIENRMDNFEGGCLVSGEFARTGLCCQCEGESIAEPGGSASGPWPASAWFGMSCGSRESLLVSDLASSSESSPSLRFSPSTPANWLDRRDPKQRLRQNRNSLLQGQRLFDKTCGKGLHTAIVLTLRIESGDDDDFRDVENDSRFCDPHPRA